MEDTYISGESEALFVQAPQVTKVDTGLVLSDSVTSTISSGGGGTNPQFIIVDYTESVTTRQGEEFEVSVTVKNIGSGTGAFTARLYDDKHNLIDSKPYGPLSPQNTVTVTLHGTGPSPGAYLYTIEIWNQDTQQVDDSKQVTIISQAVQKTSKKQDNTLLWIIIIVILLLVAGGSKK